MRKAAAGRAIHEPLLIRADGRPWRFEISDHNHPFKAAARAAKLPAGTTIYSLRHSSIARALLKNVPIKVVADWHDTSTLMIERHNGRFISRHSDDLVRAALIDTSPRPRTRRKSKLRKPKVEAPDNVVALRS